MPKKMKLFCPLRKVDEEQRLVYGVLTQEVLDKSGETFDYALSKPYFEKWSTGISEATGGKSVGNMRVMHTNKVAGIFEQMVFNDDDKCIEVVGKVVDDQEWELVKAGAYTGFSIGGRYVKRFEVDGAKKFVADPVEGSLVDNPCVPTATFSMVKADGAAEDIAFRLWQPTNDQVAEVAQELAKSAGGAWTDHIEAAREALIKAKSDKDDEDEDNGDDADEKETDPDEGDKEDDPDADDKGSADDNDKKKKSKKDAGPSGEAGDWQQVWKARDGRTFATKAEVVQYAAELNARDVAAPLTRALSDLGKATKGEKTPLDGAALVAFGKNLKLLAKYEEQYLAKGFYTVTCASRLLSELAYMASDVVWEERYEDDQTSQLPQQAIDLLDRLRTFVVTMVNEETAEMMASLQGQAGDNITVIIPDADAEMMELAAAAVDVVKANPSLLAKAGARNSKADQNRIQAVHDHSAALGASCSGADKAAGDELHKAADAELVQKFESVQAENVELRKLITDSVPVIEQLKKDVEVLKAQPMPSAPRTHVVGKGDDNGDIRNREEGPLTAERLVEKFGADELAKAAIRIAQRSPMPLMGRGSK